MLNKFHIVSLRYFPLVFIAVCVALSLAAAQDRDMGSSEGDRVALEALYSATEGSTWANDKHWNTDMPLGKWYGVATDPGSGRVTRLNLSKNRLEGEIPSQLRDLRMLELLDLSNNRLTGAIPPELEGLNKLMFLWLQGNQLEGEIPVYLKAAVERAALRDLYAFTDGENWTDNHNWLNLRVPFSDWHGVALDAAGRVTGLDLSNNGLQGNVPNGLGTLTDLENLNLSGNDVLAGPLPLDLMDLSRLMTLDISGTNLCAPTALEEWLDSEVTVFQGETCEEVSKSFAASSYILEVDMLREGGSASDAGICDRTEAVRDRLVDLVNNIYPAVVNCADVTEAHLAAITDPLDLSDGSIESLEAGDFSGLTNLTTLYLSRNRLGTLPEGVFADLASLEYLNLSYNQLRVLPVGLFSGLTNLTILHLSRNHLSTLPEGVFAGLTSLRDLDLWYTQLRTLPAGVFSGLTSLRDLDLEENELQTLPAGVFSGLSLRFLGLEGNELSTLLAGVFANLDVTLTLDLSHNRLHTLPASVFAGLANLPFLDLSVNQLSELPAGLLSGLTSLTSLWIDQNPGSPFIFTMTPERIPGTNKVVVTVAYGAPFSMTTTISTIEGTTLTSVYPVMVPAGRVMSDEIVIDSLGVGVKLAMGIVSPVPMVESGTSPFIGIKTAVCSFNEEDFTLDQVSGVKVITEGMDQLGVSWKAVCGADGYKVQWKSGSEQYSSTRQQVVTTTTYKITGLNAGTVYTVRVIARGGGIEDGLPSSEVTGRSLPPPPPPLLPPDPDPDPDPETQLPDPETQLPDPETQLPDPETQLPDPETQLPDPETQLPDPETQLPDPETQLPDPETIEDTAQENGSGGCSIASKKAAKDTPESILFKLFLIGGICAVGFFIGYRPKMTLTAVSNTPGKSLGDGTLLGKAAYCDKRGRIANSAQTSPPATSKSPVLDLESLGWNMPLPPSNTGKPP